MDRWYNLCDLAKWMPLLPHSHNQLMHVPDLVCNPTGHTRVSVWGVRLCQILTIQQLKVCTLNCNNCTWYELTDLVRDLFSRPFRSPAQARDHRQIIYGP